MSPGVSRALSRNPKSTDYPPRKKGRENRKEKENSRRKGKEREGRERGQGTKPESHAIQVQMQILFSGLAFLSVSARQEPREEVALEDSAQGLIGDRASETWCH